MKNEIFKPIPFAPQYEAGDLGNIKFNGRLLKITKRQNGRNVIYIVSRPGDARSYRYVSRLVWAAHRRPVAERCQINHINLNRTDDRLENLEEVSARENCLHYLQISKPRSLPRGVYIRRKSGRFYAQITINGIKKTLGTFATAEEAGEAYKRAAEEAAGGPVKYL